MSETGLSPDVSQANLPKNLIKSDILQRQYVQRTTGTNTSHVDINTRWFNLLSLNSHAQHYYIKLQRY